MSTTISGSKNTNEEIEKIVKQTESGQHKIYPILKPGDWVGLKAGAIKSTLIGDEDSPKVVVGFGYDTPDNFIFLTHKHLETLDANKVLEEAFQNLEDYVTEFKFSEALENKVLTSSGLDFSSERILSPNHMLKAHQMLNSEELLVTIPRRTCMMVISRDAGEKLLSSFVHLHQNAWEDDSYGNAPIANMLFVIKEGSIVGTIPLDK
ncbi:hypothetical protein I2486_15725 [Cellulophaga sp. E16_2]|uniref:DUF1444 family protein n=1 Tax=Cellulophaga algicola (strain DSM 14237 / IC166 / ACAM 630) TaxID=688270 RepID=E6X4V8_CELAD|nr:MULTISPECIES: hypothetical protein [Cellulophaga]ADV50450.1 hypothetical protein Celal_3176 [Cellulophaga algicola DSM 14237]MBO0592854.1 hypothetical protein [Cellulophaga sp. E16_2]